MVCHPSTDMTFNSRRKNIWKTMLFGTLSNFFYIYNSFAFLPVFTTGMAHRSRRDGEVIKRLSILYVFAGLSHDLLLGLCGMCSSILFLSDVAPCLPSRRHLLRDPLGGCLFSGSFNGPGHQHPHLCARACSQKFPPRHSSRAPHG